MFCPILQDLLFAPSHPNPSNFNIFQTSPYSILRSWFSAISFKKWKVHLQKRNLKVSFSYLKFGEANRKVTRNIELKFIESGFIECMELIIISKVTFHKCYIEQLLWQFLNIYRKLPKKESFFSIALEVVKIP